MISWLKKYHILHTWGKWETTDSGNIVLRDPRGIERGKIGVYVIQERTCSVCGMKQLRKE